MSANILFSGVPFLPGFIAEHPTVDSIADHVEHISKIAGKTRVGIGSDFDGFLLPPIPGMEDVSQYHSLVSSKERKADSSIFCFFTNIEIEIRLRLWQKEAGQKKNWLV